VVAKSILGDQPAFQVKVAGLGSLPDIFLYMLLGALAGLTAVLFKEALSRTKTWFESLTIPAWSKPALGGMAVGLLGMVLPQILGEGYGTVTSAMKGNAIWWLLLLLLAGKIVSTSVTLGSGAPGGAFAPSLFMGAMLGAAFNRVTCFMLPGHAALASTYALTGAAGVVAGALNAPITAGLIIFEVSGSHLVILPAMIVVSVAAVVSNRLSRGSIYTAALIKAGIQPERFRNYSHLSNILCRQAMKRNIIVASPRTKIADVFKILSRADQRIVPVTDGQDHLLGVISWQTVKLLLSEENLKETVLAYDVMSPPLPVSAEDNLLQVMLQLGKSENEQAPVIDNGRLVGIIGWRDISLPGET
jgi:CIC family chloride channel protein